MQCPVAFSIQTSPRGDTTKADQAEAAIAAGGAVSVQVLNELTNVARRKMQLIASASCAICQPFRAYDRTIGANIACAEKLILRSLSI